MCVFSKADPHRDCEKDVIISHGVGAASVVPPRNSRPMVGDFPNASSGLERARRLEREGRSEDAARVYQDAGALVDAARVLAQIHRFIDSAKLLIQASGISSSTLTPLDENGERMAIAAAKLFSPAGDRQVAEQAVEQLRRQRSLGQAGGPGGVPR